MKIGLEWLYRLLQEPGRLWQRYLINNPSFLLFCPKNPARPGKVNSNPVISPQLSLRWIGEGKVLSVPFNCV
ncbi:hypothetical protein MiAbW_02353 [Microcystis aeruginosa NIES-4325]|uniref:Uncharacterized protein n=2 Tax=Microcystis aeruginosa TaxID=1126 RepID=A0A5J4F918_MICAE|nr:hypothetical protein MiAbW_02353 [Microcystis aeruginosa NIES-4325]